MTGKILSTPRHEIDAKHSQYLNLTTPYRNHVGRHVVETSASELNAGFCHGSIKTSLLDHDKFYCVFLDVAMT